MTVVNTLIRLGQQECFSGDDPIMLPGPSLARQIGG